MTDLAEEVSAIRFGYAGVLPLGSWRLNVHATHRHYLDCVAKLFEGTFRRDRIEDNPPPDACLYLVGAPQDSIHFEAAFRGASLLPSADILVSDMLADGTLRLSSWMIQSLVDSTTKPARILCLVREQETHRPHFKHYIHAFFLKLMHVFDRFYLHASGVHHGGRTSIFIGAHHAGKTTISLRLAKAGARLISDDHVVLRKHGTSFYASGCRDTARVSLKTESFLFGANGALRSRSRNYRGLLKKEFPARRYFDHAPYQDFELHTIFFLRRGKRLRIDPITHEVAILNLLRSLEGAYPFRRRDDYIACLGYLRCLVEHRVVFDLTVGRDLRELDKVVDFLCKV
jgi:hypothetical protein